MKNKFIFLFGFLYLAGSYVYAQNTVDELLNQRASIPIPGPNVAALNKFVEFPVTHFNGQVDVSFPLYEIKLKNVSIPITLKYHTGGIRVGEEASWVGLGWALDAGGVISHQVRGLNDLVYGNYNQHFVPYRDKAQNETYIENSNLGAVPLQISGCQVPNINGQMESIKGRFWGEANNNFEPDIYIYNTGLYSGKFIYLGTLR
ncbi:MAG: hypothetical protein FWF54_00700 [Candidatus Azobacteroides sp.]|nr:hypothetical protein [Candidatus Azobacteroides sp.]